MALPTGADQPSVARKAASQGSRSRSIYRGATQKGRRLAARKPGKAHNVTRAPKSKRSSKPAAKLIAKAPLRRLPTRSGQRAGSSKSDYNIGDVVFWGTPTNAGEFTFIGHPKGDTECKILVLAMAAEVGFEVDADECAPTRRSNPQLGREYRQRCFRNHPGALSGNP